jgi:hypothetical protein
VTCERYGTRRLRPTDIGVAVATHDQRGAVEAALAAYRVVGPAVATVNAHQGLEYAVTVAWHPLSGVLDPLAAFWADRGRLCVLASRHRHAVVLVGRSGLRRLLDDPPLSPTAPQPGQPDPLLGGWLAHAALLAHLDSMGAAVAA